MSGAHGPTYLLLVDFLVPFTMGRHDSYDTGHGEGTMRCSEWYKGRKKPSNLFYEHAACVASYLFSSLPW